VSDEWKGEEAGGYFGPLPFSFKMPTAEERKAEGERLRKEREAEGTRYPCVTEPHRDIRARAYAGSVRLTTSRMGKEKRLSLSPADARQLGADLIAMANDAARMAQDDHA
jgi:hypothetical protein